MAQFNKAFTLLTTAEFSNNPKKFLHRNASEKHLTLGGIYRKYHKNAIDWVFVDEIVQVCKFDIERASVMLFNDDTTYKQVYNFFKKNFWEAIRLDEILYQNTANEIFLSAVHIGITRAVKLAQKTVGAKQDGIFGDITLKCLNLYNEEAFDADFDKKEIAFYKENNPDSQYFEGFIARATIVALSLVAFIPTINNSI